MLNSQRIQLFRMPTYDIELVVDGVANLRIRMRSNHAISSTWIANQVVPENDIAILASRENRLPRKHLDSWNTPLSIRGFNCFIYSRWHRSTGDDHRAEP